MHDDSAHCPIDTDFAAREGDTYGRLRDLFLQVADVDPEQREAWFSLNVSDADERAALERLLAADASDVGYLDVPADEHAARMTVDDCMRAEGLIGQRVGAFRLTRLLGKGGMAAVFLGEREGAGFAQQVAVKMLRRGLYSEIDQRLFRRERQLLASLEHPHIARVIDGGLTEAGIPYLVIEYVDGESITHFAAQRMLGVRERLELFLIACRAVEAAHRALIVHRDIKPSNIMVARDGTLKLLDFGIAKLVEDEGDSLTMGVFTPEYAAPEQLRGAAVTTATDVYALGVLLHELLLGLRPPANSSRRPSSLAGSRDAVHASVPRPALLPRMLRGDIDTILMKCLSAEPSQRYSSAATLADDIERHLAGKPVEAHPPSRWYRARKFVARHRASVGFGAAFGVAIIAALGVALWQAKVARSESSRAQEIKIFVESLFEPLAEGTAPDKAPTLQQLMQRGLVRVDTSFHDDPGAQAELLDMFSKIQDQVGEVKANRELSLHAYQLAEKLYGADDARTLATRERHAHVLYRLGEYDSALTELEQVRERMRARGIHGTSLAVTLEEISFVRSAQGADDDTLIALNVAAMKERESDVESTPENLAAGYNNLALAYIHANQMARALEMFRKAHALFVAAKGESYVTATSLANIGGTLFRMGQWREGLDEQMQARAMFQRMGIDSHQMLAQVLMGICDAQASLEVNDLPSACDDALNMTAKIVGDKHPRYVRALALRAAARVAAGQFDLAEKDLEAGLAIAKVSGGDVVPVQRAFDALRARIDWFNEDYAQLRRHLIAAAAGQNPHGSSAPTLFAWFAFSCAREPSDTCASDAVEGAAHVLDDPAFALSPLQLGARTALAKIELANGHPEKALSDVNAGLAIAKHELGENHSMLGDAHLVMGDAQLALGNRPLAATEYATALASVSALPAAHPLRVRIARRVQSTQ